MYTHIQNHAKTSTKVIKPHKMAKRAETSQKTIPNQTKRRESSRDQPQTIQNQTKRSESSRDQHKTCKTIQNGETGREQPKPYKTQQYAARAAETSTKYMKPHKTAKLTGISQKLYAATQNAVRAVVCVCPVMTSRHGILPGIMLVF